MNKLNFFLIIYFFLISCTSLEEAGKVLRNEKIKTTDEFLIEKKEPLVLPPDYKVIPKPGSLSNKKKEEKNLKQILKATNKEQGKKGSSSTEQSIIDKIRK
tara:strand:+ start:650 stop:952 length:303 start_codon:yes stop_codon:yes gene_type:complete